MPTHFVAHLHFLPTQKPKQKNAKELPSQRTKTLQTMDRQATTDRTPAPNTGLEKVASSVLILSFVLRINPFRCLGIFTESITFLNLFILP